MTKKIGLYTRINNSYMNWYSYDISKSMNVYYIFMVYENYTIFGSIICY